MWWFISFQISNNILKCIWSNIESIWGLLLIKFHVLPFSSNCAYICDCDWLWKPYGFLKKKKKITTCILLIPGNNLDILHNSWIQLNLRYQSCSLVNWNWSFHGYFLEVLGEEVLVIYIEVVNVLVTDYYCYVGMLVELVCLLVFCLP